MGLSGDVAADLVEMHRHGLRVRPRQHEPRPLTVSRTDGTVKPDPAKAFDIFAHRMDEWVPGEHSLFEHGRVDLVVEARAGGQWYEVDAASNRCQWGRVEAYQPPELLVLIWQLSPEFEFDASIETRLEIRFDAAPGGGTRIRFEHSGLAAYGDQAAAMRARLEAPDAWTYWFEGLQGLIG